MKDLLKTNISQALVYSSLLLLMQSFFEFAEEVIMFKFSNNYKGLLEEFENGYYLVIRDLLIFFFILYFLPYVIFHGTRGLIMKYLNGKTYLAILFFNHFFFYLLLTLIFIITIPILFWSTEVEHVIYAHLRRIVYMSMSIIIVSLTLKKYYEPPS